MKGWQRGFAEFLAIFAGITLSLLADDWRDERRDREERVVAFEQLRDDLSDDLDQHAFVRNRAEALRLSSSWLLTRWEMSGVASDSLETALAAFALPLTFEYRSPAYSSLKGGNGLSLISGTDLGRSLIEYFEEDQVSASNFATGLSASKARLAEALYAYVDLPEYVAPARPTHMLLASSWRKLTQDRVLRNRLMELNQLSVLTVEFVGPAVENAEELAERIDEELGRSR